MTNLKNHLFLHTGIYCFFEFDEFIGIGLRKCLGLGRYRKGFRGIFVIYFLDYLKSK